MTGLRAAFNWSGGKDSALCLHRVLQSGQYTVVRLLTTVNDHYQRISMHGVRTALLEAQAASVGIPLTQIRLPEMPDMPTYESIMGEALAGMKRAGIEACIFGDIFLEDLRRYREQKLAEIGMEAVFPLWQIPTDQLVGEFINLGFKAVVVCVDDRYLDQSFAGREIDETFLRDLPSQVDPCGENGEFHSFVYDGPLFKAPVVFELGDLVHRHYTRSQQDRVEHPGQPDPDPFDTGFWYRDLVPVSTLEKT